VPNVININTTLLPHTPVDNNKIHAVDNLFAGTTSAAPEERGAGIIQEM
jgi:hypothetical protein